MALCPSCGAVVETEPCPECGSSLSPGPSPALMALVGLLWVLSVLGLLTGVRILQGTSPVQNRTSGALFFLPLLLALAVTLLWIRRASRAKEKSV